MALLAPPPPSIAGSSRATTEDLETTAQIVARILEDIRASSHPMIGVAAPPSNEHEENLVFDI